MIMLLYHNLLTISCPSMKVRNKHEQIPPPSPTYPSPSLFPPRFTFTAGSYAEFQVDEYNRLSSVFFYLKPCADILSKAGFPVLALDGTHIKYESKGVVLALVGRDTNNRLRNYLPRSTEPTALTNRYLRSICHRLNTTPRKCLGYRTPAEVFESKLMEIQNRLE